MASLDHGEEFVLGEPDGGMADGPGTTHRVVSWTHHARPAFAFAALGTALIVAGIYAAPVTLARALADRPEALELSQDTGFTPTQYLNFSAALAGLGWMGSSCSGSLESDEHGAPDPTRPSGEWVCTAGRYQGVAYIDADTGKWTVLGGARSWLVG
ncbi:hypothetical protein [Occultella kanbiaonis]|uniref:hypothetical protein n=1 Tax=Occultella kanbiaonis TaxID=2675754 RepID=UPI0012B93CAB|nr:hypothetical protein [Occultella kanbiaonis]